MINEKLYSEMVNAIEKAKKWAGTISRWEAINFFIGYFKILDEEKIDLIGKLCADGIITK